MLRITPDAVLDESLRLETVVSVTVIRLTHGAYGLCGCGCLGRRSSARPAAADLASGSVLCREPGRAFQPGHCSQYCRVGLSLQGARDALAAERPDQVSPVVRREDIFGSAVSAEYLCSLLVLRPDGTISADSTAPSSHDLNLSERGYFAIHRDMANAGFFIRRPFKSPLQGAIPVWLSIAASMHPVGRLPASSLVRCGCYVVSSCLAKSISAPRTSSKVGGPTSN